MSDDDEGVLTVHSALWSALGYLPGYAVSVVVVSVLWSVASIPVVTVGPATLGAYAAARSLRDESRVDRGFVLATLREHGLDALLLGGVAIVTSTVSLLYFSQFVRTGSTVAGVLGVAGVYVTLHYLLVLAPTFVALVDGAPLSSAIRTGYRWTIERPFQAVSMLILTALLLVGSVVLTVAVVLVFPAVAAAFHTELLVPVVEPPSEPAPAQERRPAGADYPDPRD
ncbi:MAG: hypothetical protein ABEJ26_01605 [Halosimplex sp.]